jgi:hypothetical protein
MVFADSLSGANFLVDALESVTDPEESQRLAQELTALGNRILSANLVNLGELEGVRPSLEEMRDTLTIGLEYLTGGKPDRAADVFRKSYVHTIFKVGFGQIAKLRTQADALAGTRGLQMEMLDTTDREFVEALRRFKPLLIEEGRYRSFRSMADVDAAQSRLQALTTMVRTFLPQFPSIATTFARAFNTATIRTALYGKFEIVPLGPTELKDLEAWLANGFELPPMQVPAEFAPFAERWRAELRSELEPLVGKKIDARFVQVILVKL